MKCLILSGMLSFFLVGQISCIPNNNPLNVYTKERPNKSEEWHNVLKGVLVGAAIPAVAGMASYLLADDPMMFVDGQTRLDMFFKSPMVITVCAGGLATVGSVLGIKYCDDNLYGREHLYSLSNNLLGAGIGSGIATVLAAAILDPNRN
ncbi:MAG: hypothetical protein WD055_06050 [Candidatus Dependentiae bacterium]